MFLGIDSSTQSLSAIVLDVDKGEVVASCSVNFGQDLPQYQAPSGFIPGGANGEVHSDPLMWLDALDLLCRQLADVFDLSRITHIAGSGQQHGSVYLGGNFEETLRALSPSTPLSAQLKDVLARPTSPIWMDTSTPAECAEIAQALGGADEVCARSGSIPIERFTGPQIRKFHKNQPDAYKKTSVIHLVSSFIASIFAGKSMPIDHGDGAGMNLLNLATLTWDPKLLDATAPALEAKLPNPSACLDHKAPISAYFSEKYGFANSCQVSPFTGDNPASLVGMGATTPGQVVISLGTSDTFFAAMPKPKTDPEGYGHVFGNPAGGFMSLICFRNGSLAREALRDELAVDWRAFDKDALAETVASAGQNITLPFYSSEITPRFDFTEPTYDFHSDETPSTRIRSLLEGQFLNMQLHSQWLGIAPTAIRLTGGAAQNDGIAQIVADVFQAPVERFQINNSAALGAALIAATAAGNDLAELQNAFCKAAPNSTILPNQDLAEKYSTALARYTKLLHTEIS